MANQIEVEFIGSLTNNKFEELKELFAKQGKFKKQKQRLSFMYFKNKIPKELEEIKDELIDLRIRITNKEPEVMLKYGLFTGSHARKEIALNPSQEELPNYVDFLKGLGWHLGVLYATETFVYTYKGIEFSLIKIKDYGYNFEAEIMTDENKIEETKTEINKQLIELGLKTFDESGLNKQCNEINNKKDLQFDFLKDDFEQIKERFADFF